MDVSVAVATPNGLIVPVIRDAQKLSLAEIEKKIEDFSKRGRDGTITLPEMIGGDLQRSPTAERSGPGWVRRSSIPRRAPFWGCHAIKKKPWVNEKDEIVVRQIMAGRCHVRSPPHRRPRCSDIPSQSEEHSRRSRKAAV